MFLNENRAINIAGRYNRCTEDLHSLNPFNNHTKEKILPQDKNKKRLFCTTAAFKIRSVINYCFTKREIAFCSSFLISII